MRVMRGDPLGRHGRCGSAQPDAMAGPFGTGRQRGVGGLHAGTGTAQLRFVTSNPMIMDSHNVGGPSPETSRGTRTMGLFLSYAEEDGRTALEIATRLGQRFEVYDWQRQRGGRFLERIEREINKADAYVALLSPHFLASPYCRLERELAIHRELDLQARDPSVAFVHVIRIAETPYPDAGFLRSYDWLGLTSAEEMEQGMAPLVARLASSGAAVSVHDAPSQGKGAPMFRNRDHELEKVQRGLVDPGGPHFWLLIVPIQLGKSWFLQQLGTRMAFPSQSDPAAESTQWVVKLVDVREQPLDARGDAGLLLASLFGRTSPVATDPEGLLEIAREINRVGRPYLCLLDSAELLVRETAKTLRSCLSQIYELVQQAHSMDARLAFVVASRQEAEWLGVAPAPRLATQSLSEFTVEVLRQALEDLARQMRRRLADSDLQQATERVRRLSEGLPALLVLAPYRLFTQSHLRHHIQSDPALGDALTGLGWTIENLWQAISETALLSPLQSELWQETCPPIRRLLYRRYFRADERRADAHREARKFVEVWVGKQGGTEQVVGLV